jgi:hypothetical protein
VTDGTEVKQDRDRWISLDPRGRVEPLRWHPSRTELKGFAISDRFWSKWRRNRDGNSPDSGPRPLKQLLKQVEKAAQVRQSGIEQVLAELKLHRDTTADSELQSALAFLCNALARLVKSPNAAHSRQTLMAADAVKRVSP